MTNDQMATELARLIELAELEPTNEWWTTKLTIVATVLGNIDECRAYTPDEMLQRAIAL